MATPSREMDGARPPLRAPGLRGRAREPELFRVTLLFADIHGSTEMIQHLDPERAAGLLDPFVRAMEDVVAAYEGVSSARGDGIMAMFGPPMLAEGHPVRGCLAALEILARMQREQAPAVRIGINCGDVLVRTTQDGRPRLDQIFGSAIHLASRLEEEAEPGTALLSPAAFELVRHAVDAERLAPRTLKGIDGKVEPLRLLRRKDAPVRLTRSPAEFVGRERERRALQAAAKQDAPGVRVIHVLGEPGIGKSRLLQEFLGTPAASQAYVVRLLGSVLRSRVPFDPIEAWLSTALGLTRGGEKEARRARLSHALAPYGALSGPQRQAVEHLLDRAAPTPLPGRELVLAPALDMVAPLAAIIRIQAGERRLLFACEDIDTFDGATMRLLQELLDALGDRTVLVVTTSRVRVPLAGDGGKAQQVRLGPLPDADARALLSALGCVTAADARRARQLLAKAGGNPLFLEEVVSLEADAAGRRVAGEASGEGDDIPDLVEALIVDRLQRLPEDARRVLRVAAVIGFEVKVGLLERATGVPREAMRRILGRLAEHLLPEGQGFEGRGMVGPHIRFRHALTRDVAYRSLLPTQRQRLHAEIAGHLEAEASDDPARHLEALCYHTERGGLAEKAIHYLQLAAGMAAELSAPSQAEDYLRHALDIARGLADAEARRRSSVDILLSLRSLAELTLRYQDAMECVDEAARLADELGDEAVAMQVQARRLRPLNVLGQLEEAVRIGEWLRGRCRETGAAELGVMVAHALGQSYFHVGRFRDADATFSEMIDAGAATTGHKGVRVGSTWVLILATRGAARAFLGRFAEAEQDAAEALARAARDGRPYDMVYARFIQGFVALNQRRLTEAIATFRGALAQAQARSVPAFIPSLQSGLGHALILQPHPEPGDLAEAITMLEAARVTTADRQRVTIRLWATLALSMAHGCAGNDLAALRLADDAVMLGKRFGLHGFLVPALRHRALVRAAASPEAEGAWEDLAAALRVARRLGMRPEAAHTLIAASVVRPAQGVARFGRGRHLLASIGMQDWADRLASLPSLRQAF